MSHPFDFLDDSQVITQDPKQIEHYSKDWTRQFPVRSAGVLFPKSTDEVQKIIQTCNSQNLKLVPSGGRTGLSGGAVASCGEWVLSLEKMNQIFKVSSIDSSIHVQAGVVTDAMQEEAKKHGLCFPVQFGATGSSQIGGNVATNAGGVHVVKYGPTRDWVKSLKVVTGKGDVLDLNHGLIKNNTGYDLRQLFVASEGTLGVITELEVGLTPLVKEKQVILLGVETLDKILDCFLFSKNNLPLHAFEMFTDLALKKVLEAQNQLQKPIESDCPYYVLIEVEINESFTTESLTENLETYFEKEWAIDGTLSANSEQYENLWKYRELISESIAKYTPYKNDVSVKISKLPDFIEAIQQTVLKEHSDLEVAVYGHIGDGNLHVNTLKPDSMPQDEFLKKCESVNKLLFSEIKRLEGSISAEHGVGLLKKPYLSFSKSKEEIEYMKALKLVFDPHQILNPGKIF